MNRKVAKIIRAMAQRDTIGQYPEKTRKRLKVLKRQYLRSDTGQHPKLEQPRKRKVVKPVLRTKQPTYSAPSARVF